MADKSNQADARDVPLPENHNAASKQSSSKAKTSRSRRSQSSPGDRGAVTKITRLTYSKGRRTDMKKAHVENPRESYTLTSTLFSSQF
ncbi:hypothetical protein F2Q70_00004010 [Brassica cretica]|uniref:Uncharacterized protein n=1 Tax=Brassica cretica TaxID=69181 RepID=A0A8S9IXF9_BRACR|nr:hypothetical protein F2Q70_00004010 [Brassica cretica]